MRVLSGFDREELPGSVDAFEFVFAAVVEVEACSGDEHGYRGRDPEFAGCGSIEHAGSDVDGDAGDVGTSRISTSPVCRPARISMPSGRSASRSAIAQRIARPGPSKVARMPSPVVLTAVRACCSTTVRAMTSWLSRSCATRDRPAREVLGRSDEVGEQDRGQRPVGLARTVQPAEELLDVLQARLSRFGEQVDVATG